MSARQTVQSQEKFLLTSMMICRDVLNSHDKLTSDNIKMIKLDLRNHCIQTEAKRIYNQGIAQYFNSDSDKIQLEVQIEMLKTLLETCDFPRLRSKYPELAGHSHNEVALATDQRNRIVVLINGKIIDPF